MRLREKGLTGLLNRLNLTNLTLIFSRGYRIKDESISDDFSQMDLKRVSPITIALTLSTFVGIFLIGNLGTQYLKNLFDSMRKAEFFWQTKIPPLKLMLAIQPMTKNQFLVTFLVAMIVSYTTFKRMGAKFNELSFGQIGDSRLTTIEEIQEQYIEIPDRETSFDGVGGVPVTHYKKSYYIDRDTVNTAFIGTSRSGKGEMFVFPMIDNLSRSKEKSSMVINDPKGELFAASKETLEARGFQVEVLNIAEPEQGMSYNLLNLIMDAWNQGDKPLAQMLTDQLSFGLFFRPDAGQNKWVYDGASKLLNGVILAVVDECTQNNHLEKITMYNCLQMIIELSAKMTNVLNENEEEVAMTGLDAYFYTLPQGHLAKSQYSSYYSMEAKAKGTIMSTVLEILNIFQFENIAKMTSSNSFDLKAVGFPKSLFLKMDTKTYDQNFVVEFISEDKVIGFENIRPNMSGAVSLNFKESLTKGDRLRVRKRNSQKKIMTDKSIIFELVQVPLADDILRTAELKLIKDEMEVIENFSMSYSEKPIAVFMITPDYDVSKNVLASIFVRQMYTVLAQNASNTRGNKCHNRVHFILDEAGNMPAIESMDNIMTVCLGRNILFNLFLQSYRQLNKLYGEHTAAVIKENCQNHIYIMSTDFDTQEEISKKAGMRTVTRLSVQDKVLDTKTQNTKSIAEERLIPQTRLSTMIMGETLVIRSLHREDNKRRKVRPFPIFNSKLTAMPYRYEFLAKEFNTNKAVEDFQIESAHKNLSIEKNALDMSMFKPKVELDFEPESIKESAMITKEDATKILSTAGKDDAIIGYLIDSTKKVADDYKQLKKIFLDPAMSLTKYEVRTLFYFANACIGEERYDDESIDSLIEEQKVA